MQKTNQTYTITGKDAIKSNCINTLINSAPTDDTRGTKHNVTDL